MPRSDSGAFVIGLLKVVEIFGQVAGADAAITGVTPAAGNEKARKEGGGIGSTAEEDDGREGATPCQRWPAQPPTICAVTRSPTGGRLGRGASTQE